MTYKVASGDTLFTIAQHHNITLQALEAANPGVDPKTLHIGQVLNLPSSSSGAHPPAPPHGGGNGYVQYSGPASQFPNKTAWASWDSLWTENVRLMKYHDTEAEIADIKRAIETVAKESGVDQRVILCIIVQESGGNVRSITTDNGVRNPGLMQSHNGVEWDPKNSAASILQMVRDGTEGTKDGPGLKQLHAQYGNWYEAFRAYNSGSVDKRDLNDPKGATGSYVRDAANRLMGHVWAGM